MKTCTVCSNQKSLEEFSSNAKSKDGKHYMCKPCKRAYDNEYYKKNPARKNYIENNRQQARLDADKYIFDYLLTHHCVDCGESDPIVLEFDHVKGNKIASVANLKRYSVTAVAKEIDKCEVRCANCHRRKTAKQFSWANKTPL
jgi:hypothetical protein